MRQTVQAARIIQGGFGSELEHENLFSTATNQEEPSRSCAEGNLACQLFCAMQAHDN